MSELDDELDTIFPPDRTLLIDGDILIYKPCCVFNEDTPEARDMIASNIRANINKLCDAAQASSYVVYLTTKKNFRNFLVDDYKANRADVERPVNLAWAKKFAVHELGGEYVAGLEADDLLAINQTDDTVIWSLDKDLRQVPGMHLDDETQQVIHIDELGTLEKRGSKYYFTGFKGLMFQALIGDTADYIIGCGERKEHTYKSGKKAGQKYMKRVGVGPAEAYKILNRCSQTMDDFKHAVIREYVKLFPNNYTKKMEQQVNLLYMVKLYYQDNKLAHQWTVDDRVQFINVETGEVSEYAN